MITNIVLDFIFRWKHGHENSVRRALLDKERALLCLEGVTFGFKVPPSSYAPACYCRQHSVHQSDIITLHDSIRFGGAL